MATTTTAKVCTKCNTEKPLIEFNYNKQSKDGYFCICKNCTAIYKKEYNQSHTELLKERRRKYYMENREQCVARCKLYRQKHQERLNAQNKIYNDDPETKQQRRDRLLRKTYGINNIEYNELFVIQDGRCAICGTHQMELRKRLAVDHNHKTGKIRKLLCPKCNCAIGAVDEKVDLLEMMIRYIQTDGDMENVTNCHAGI